ncbi:flagellar motor protein MotS [Virgibacillus sp. W0181]|uniref:flagellar motor protein MotS n=1 Tax=Virgibacillus sp. W0181 TaxID=3391581 RepID=UPI003F4570E5
MRRREARKSKKNGAPKWMVTYSDMVTLILVFFILLFSFSQIDLVKFEAVSESFRNRMIFDFYPSPVPMENPTENTSHEEAGKNSNEFDVPAQEADVMDEEDSLNNLMNNVEKFLNENGLNDVVSADRTERGIVLVLQERILFDSGEAQILQSGKPFLNEMGALLTKIPNHVKVEGHTDNRPISNYRYPSNWELSGARAGSVIRYLINKNDFDESRFSVAGYGDTRPLVANDSPKNWSKNRRVEIVILEEDAQVDE